MLRASRIVGVARLLFESGDYFVHHFRRCGDYLRAASDRVNTVLAKGQACPASSGLGYDRGHKCGRSLTKMGVV